MMAIWAVSAEAAWHIGSIVNLPLHRDYPETGCRNLLCPATAESEAAIEGRFSCTLQLGHAGDHLDAYSDMFWGWGGA